jgi:hypothetical protein
LNQAGASAANQPACKEEAINTHPYLRAYLAGIFVPTLVLPVILAGFIVARQGLAASFPIERFLVFPLALVPTLFGLWNMLYMVSHGRIHQSIGLHGAMLPIVGAPIGALVAYRLGLLQFGAHGATYFQCVQVPYTLLPVFVLAAMAGYYLVWKYIVGFVNRVLGIA